VKIGVNKLRQIIRENIHSLLVEEKKEEKLKQDSLDEQVDKYLSDYEKESKSLKQEGFNHRSITSGFLRSLLVEEEKEKEDKEDVTKKEKLTSDDISLEDFAMSVVRLIDNYDSLLEVRETLARRAVNFIAKNYDESTVKEFKLILEESHDISVDGPEEFVDDSDKFPAPRAANAGPGNIGGA
jgi:hypothetical protein